MHCLCAINSSESIESPFVTNSIFFQRQNWTPFRKNDTGSLNSWFKLEGAKSDETPQTSTHIWSIHILNNWLIRIHIKNVMLKISLLCPFTHVCNWLLASCDPCLNIILHLTAVLSVIINIRFPYSFHFYIVLFLSIR